MAANLLPLALSIDHAQRRRSKDRLSLFAQASFEGRGGERVTGLDLVNTSSDIWQDRATWSIMLRPQPTRDTWLTSNSGNNAKLAASAFTLSGSSGDWQERQDQQAKGPWIGRTDLSTSGTAITTATYTKNRGFSIAAMLTSRGETFKAFECGWNSSASNAGGVALTVWSDGFIQVYKGGVLVGDGTITQSESPSGSTQPTFHLLLIPGRRRDLLVLSLTPGGGFAHSFADIEEDDADPIITPAQKFWWKIYPGCAHIQAAPLIFATSGAAIWPEAWFAEAPEGSRSVFPPFAYHDLSYVGTESATASMVEAASPGSVFAANGVKRTARVKVAIAGGGTTSPMVYGAVTGYEAEYADTDDSEQVDLLELSSNLTITVSDKGGGTSISFDVPDPDNSGIEQWEHVSNRPLLVKLGSRTLFDGRSLPPRWKLQPDSRAVIAQFKGLDPWIALRRYIVREKIVLSGQDLAGMIEELVQLGTGIPVSNISISPDPAITIGGNAAPVKGEWSVIIQEGDNLETWVKRLFDKYLGGWFFDFVPGTSGIQFRARPPVTTASAANCTVYPTHEAAIAALISEGETDANIRAKGLWLERTAQSLEFYSAAPEATEVRLTGFDHRDRRYLQAFYRDSAAEDPTVLPSLRGENWQGERMGFFLSDPILATQDLVNDATDLKGDQLTRVRKFCEFTSGLLMRTVGELPIWRGDVVEISGYGKYRIRSLSIASVKEPTSDTATGRDAWRHRACRYLGEKLEGTTAPWGRDTGASRLADVVGRIWWQDPVGVQLFSPIVSASPRE